MAGTVVEWITFGGDIERLGDIARRGVPRSQPLRDALWLNGRANRTAVDYFMIHEYARRGLGGVEGISRTTGTSAHAQGRLTDSADNLSPLEGDATPKGREGLDDGG